MHLADITRLRTVPAAAVYLALTRRCPLSCAHCSTESSMRSEQYPADPFHRLVDSFGAADRPEMICMSGGEALLRADLVRRLSARAHEVGTGVLLLSGMYFARGGRAIPAAVRDAVRGVDHFSASLDAYHEREVDRREVFRALRRIPEWGPQVSLHITGLDDDDP
ncbi:MAG: radical SAM protein, partial [Actinomycetia bacterium]|nr:radical SAM protein [Actinomycetes bacterium]